MCGRFTLTRPDLDALAREFGAAVVAETARLHRPRWNIAPTQLSPILVDDGRRRILPARFGVEVAGGLVINARSESAATLRSFRNAFAHTRCVVLADGFYEWQGDRGDRRPTWFHSPDGKLLRFAGLALPHEGQSGCVILTTAANDTIRPLHDRMPALLSPEGALTWLTRSEPDLLVPAPADALVGREASPDVNDVANEGPALHDAPAPRRQLTLL